MNKKELVDLGIDEETAQKVIVLNGKSIEKYKKESEKLKTDAETSVLEVERLTTQLTEAGTTIESFKNLDVEAIQASADDWKEKAEKAQKEAKEQVDKMKYSHALDGALTSAKAKNVKAVKALLETDKIVFDDEGKLTGLEDQLTEIKKDNDYLFESDKKEPKIITGGNNENVLTDKTISAARAAAGLNK